MNSATQTIDPAKTARRAVHGTGPRSGSAFWDSKTVARHCEWATPQDFFDRLHAEFGFTLDAAASAHNAKLPRFFTADVDGLAQSWAGERVWCNPPYSTGPRSGAALRAWVQKAFGESQRGALCVLLVPARTDSVWFHEYAVKGEVRFVRGRLNFRDVSGAPCRPQPASVTEGRHGVNWNSPFASCVVIFRPNDAGEVRRNAVTSTGLLAVSGSGDK